MRFSCQYFFIENSIFGVREAVLTAISQNESAKFFTETQKLKNAAEFNLQIKNIILTRAQKTYNWHLFVKEHLKKKLS